MPENKKEAKLGGSNWRPRVKLGPVVPSDTKPKVGPNFLCFGILKHKKGSKFVSEERRHTKHKSVNGEGGGRMARSSGRVEWESDRFQ